MKINVIVEVDDDHIKEIDNIIEDLEASGFVVEDILGKTSGICGSVSSMKQYYSLIKVPNVSSVELENVLEEEQPQKITGTWGPIL